MILTCEECLTSQYVVEPDQSACINCPIGGECNGSWVNGKGGIVSEWVVEDLDPLFVRRRDWSNETGQTAGSNETGEAKPQRRDGDGPPQVVHPLSSITPPQYTQVFVCVGACSAKGS